VTDPGRSPGDRAVKLSPKVESAIRFQEYGRSASLDGVQIVPLRKHRDEEGWFMELFRLAGGDVSHPGVGAGFTLQQLSVSHARPGRMNAFHIHPTVPQNEIWVVVQGQLVVWLVDCRSESATADERQRVILSAEDPRALVIPAGVAHGYRSGPDGALLVYGMDQRFDPAAGNEGRLPWDFFGADLWERDLG
jgi:dTDP-4-dehydrorhamnose 3,5-epimerase